MKEIDVQRHLHELDVDGYTIVRDVMSPAEIDDTRQAIEDVLAVEADIGRRIGTQTDDLRVVYEAQGKHPHFYGFVIRNQGPLQLARSVLGEDLVCFSLALRNPMPTGNKDTTKHGGHMHVDHDFFTVKPFSGGRHYVMAIQSAWCVSDFTKESGGTIIWPGSHRSLEAPYHDSVTTPEGSMIVEAPAGSVIMWDSAVWHTAGINYGHTPRYTVISYFQRWWIKGYNDALYRCTPEARSAMTKEERIIYGLEARSTRNTFVQNMSEEQKATLTPEERSVLGFTVH